MSLTRKNVPITYHDWTRLTDDGTAAVTVAQRVVGNVLFFIGSTAPAIDDDHHTTLSSGEFHAARLKGQNVWARGETGANVLEIELESSGFVETRSVGGVFVIAAPVLTRPANATAYAVGDLVANAGAAVPLRFAGVAVEPGEAVQITRARLTTPRPAQPDVSFRLHLFDAPPATAVVDNAAFNLDSVLSVDSLDGYLGHIDIVPGVSSASGSFGTGVPDGDIVAAPASGDVFGLLEARGAYVPAPAETFTVKIEGRR